MILNDPEFGEIIVRKNSLSRGIKFSVSTSGRLQMSVPKYVGNFLVKRFLNANRDEIRKKLPIKDPKTQRARDAKKKLLMKKRKTLTPNPIFTHLMFTVKRLNLTQPVDSEWDIYRPVN